MVAKTNAYIVKWQTNDKKEVILTEKNHRLYTDYQYSTTTLRFNGHFPGGPELAGTRICPFWILFELRLMEVVMTTGAVRRTKLQSNRHHQQTNTQIFTGRMPFLLLTQQCQSTEGKSITFHGFNHPSSPGVFQPCL